MQELSTPLDAGFDPCNHHVELDHDHRTWMKIYTVVREVGDTYHESIRPIDPFCEHFRDSGYTGGVETVVTDDGRVICRAANA